MLQHATTSPNAAQVDAWNLCFGARRSPFAQASPALSLALLCFVLAIAGCGDDTDPGVQCRAGFEPPSEARSCEVVLADIGAGVASVEFSADVVGEWINEAPSSALAFHPASNAAMGASAAVVTTAEGGGFTVASARCFDDAGNEIPGIAERFGAATESCQ